MVLGELGSQITSALRKMTTTTVLDQSVIDAMLKEICFALIQADVRVTLVGQLRKDIQNRIKLAEIAPGVNKRKVVQKVRRPRAAPQEALDILARRREGWS